MIVVDTCIIVHLFTETELSIKAQQVLNLDPYWCTSATWSEEYANVLLKLSKKISLKSKDILTIFKNTHTEMSSREYKIEVIDALKCAINYNISVYDAHFVELAKQLKIFLITEDKEILKKCPSLAFSMEKFIKLNINK